VVFSSNFKLNIMIIVKRMRRQTPSFFKKLRNIGLSVTAVAAAMLAGPAVLPAVLVKIAGYLTVAGGVVTAVSQTAVKNDN
jgi:hypothetical protein